MSDPGKGGSNPGSVRVDVPRCTRRTLQRRWRTTPRRRTHLPVLRHPAHQPARHSHDGRDNPWPGRSQYATV